MDVVSVAHIFVLILCVFIQFISKIFVFEENCFINVNKTFNDSSQNVLFLTFARQKQRDQK